MKFTLSPACSVKNPHIRMRQAKICVYAHVYASTQVLRPRCLMLNLSIVQNAPHDASRVNPGPAGFRLLPPVNAHFGEMRPMSNVQFH